MGEMERPKAGSAEARSSGTAAARTVARSGGCCVGRRWKGWVRPDACVSTPVRTYLDNTSLPERAHFAPPTASLSSSPSPSHLHPHPPTREQRVRISERAADRLRRGHAITARLY